MKILNLYACLGGNRYKWDELSDDLEITSVELDVELAKLYQERFPNDNIVVADAHQYLLDHYKEFDFIWSSPPCPTHSRVRVSQKNTPGYKPKYPDMRLYQEIIFLETHFEGKFVVENVIPYYEPLIPAKKRGRHLFWTNFNLPNNLNGREHSIMGGKDEIARWSEFHDYDFRRYKGSQRRDKIARDLVDYEVGKTILSVAMNMYKPKETPQVTLF